MRTDKLNPITLTESDHHLLADLLLNAWTAEFALRIPPVGPDPADVRQSAENILFQAYECVAYSLRTVLLTEGKPMVSQLSLILAAQTLHLWGFYQDTALRPHFLEDLVAHQEMVRRMDREAKEGEATEAPFRLNLPLTYAEVVETQRYLLTVVEAAIGQHERYLLQLLGLDAFVQLITSAPQQVRTNFLDKRLLNLFLQHTQVEGLLQ